MYTDNDSDFLTVLQEKEAELQKQLAALRVTIEMFGKQQLNGHNGDHKRQETGKTKNIPKTFEEAVTWNAKILYALNKIESGFVQDIVDELKKNMTDDDNTLFRKITTNASAMKGNKILGAKKVGMRYKYYIK